MENNLIDSLCSNWVFDIDNLEHIRITVNGKEYIRKIYNPIHTEKAYIIFKQKKYYFENLWND